MKRSAGHVAIAVALALVPTAGRAQTFDTPSPSLEGARRVIAAKAEASTKNAPGGVIAVVDDGKIVGAVGVSGAACAEQDDDLAVAGAVAIGAPAAIGTAGAPSGGDLATYVPSDKVQAAFAKGMPMIETGAYKVHASRRDRDGQAEVHARDTDILYVLEGTATLVTGGQVVNGKTTGEDEVRGDAIAGGDVRRLVKVDLVVVPNGLPHLFRDVKSPFLYYVVKVTTPRREP
jgi:mannose-6-phosphate isomerase-like protein (cupin superfamily)